MSDWVVIGLGYLYASRIGKEGGVENMTHIGKGMPLDAKSELKDDL